MSSLIREPALEWAGGQDITLRLSPLTLPAGRTLDDFSTFALTIRADPAYPRSGSSAVAARTADPLGDGWPVAVSAVGQVVAGVVTFSFVTPSLAGRSRFALDVWGELDGGGEIQLVPTTWLTILPRVTP